MTRDVTLVFLHPSQQVHIPVVLWVQQQPWRPQPETDHQVHKHHCLAPMSPHHRWEPILLFPDLLSQAQLSFLSNNNPLCPHLHPSPVPPVPPVKPPCLPHLQTLKVSSTNTTTPTLPSQPPIIATTLLAMPPRQVSPVLPQERPPPKHPPPGAERPRTGPRTALEQAKGPSPPSA